MTKRLLLSYLTITVVVLLLLEIPLAVFYSQRERERITADIEHDATVLATLYEDALEQDDPLDPGPSDNYKNRTGARVVVVDVDGLSKVDTDMPADRDFSTRPEIARALAGVTASGTRPSDTLLTDLVYVAVPVASGGTVHGALRITFDTSHIASRIHRFWLALGGIALTVLAAVAVVGWALARSVTRPIRQLNLAATRFAAGDLNHQPETGAGPPEIRELAELMATMAHRLEELLRSQRAFVADASHQLRTPLTALRLRLDNLQEHLPADQSTELDAAIDETNRLANLVSSLLHLARADERLPHEIADLAQRARERADTWTAVSDSHGVAMAIDVPSAPILVRAAVGAIDQILDNLIDNAINASPVAGTVTVHVSADGSATTLTISDEGPGLPDEHKTMATERFWRGTTSKDGTGLGLAIVTALVSASGGSVRLDDAPSGAGLRVTVTFAPATPDD